MKKIFAIALALVMVLSMASAFAANCVTPNWDCAEDVCALGKGKIEVIPYVKGNGCNGTGNTWAVNTCAGAVFGDAVYFAVKVTVDANPNTEWWNDAAFKFETKGLGKVGVLGSKVPAGNLAEGRVAQEIIKLDTKGQDDLIAGEYYLVYDRTDSYVAVKAEDFVAGDKTLFTAKVEDASKAKVCAVLDAENDFTKATVNGYTVEYNKGVNPRLVISKGTKCVWVYVDEDDKIVKFDVSVDNSATHKSVTTFSFDGAKFHDDVKDEDFDWTCIEEGKFLKAVMDSFKLAFKTCITEKAVIANFGWDDEVKSCFTWSDKVVSVVDAECVVAIPKTGDASVLAWLF